MAERRMFSKTIMGSDTFTDMPASAQMLYVHLCLQADDDGFLGNPKKIQRMMGCSADDFSELIDENFVIPFPSGVIAITHWKINNQIKKDRYKETIYLKEKALLHETETKAYELKKDGEEGTALDTDRNQIGAEQETDRNRHGSQSDTAWIQNGSKTEPQYSIGKVSIDKDSIGKDSIGKVSPVQYSSVEVSSVSSSEACSFKDEETKAEETKEEAEETKKQKQKERENERERPITVLPLRDGKEYPIFQKHVDTWSIAYPLIKVADEFIRMKGWFDEHPKGHQPPDKIAAFIVNWLSDAQRKACQRPVAPPPPKPSFDLDEFFEAARVK